MKIILLKSHEVGPGASPWAEALSQFFARHGSHCVCIRPDSIPEAETRRLLDSVMDSAGLAIVETHSEATPFEGLIPDYTITVEPNANWHKNIGQVALLARLRAQLDSIDYIDNEQIVIDHLQVTSATWSPEEQRRLDDAMVALGWAAQQSGDGRLHWRRNSLNAGAASEEA